VSGTVADLLASKDSLTGMYLSGRRSIEVPATRRRRDKQRQLTIVGAREHNLKDVTLRVPIGRMTVVAGVSGSGKSTLVRRVLYPALRKALGLVSDVPGAHDKLTGHQYVKRAMAVDQSPIGRSPRSVPATFLGVWDEVRRLFASLPESKIRGYGPARFSFNSAAAGAKVRARSSARWRSCPT
jgi:excinuclease ABC subunit A